jgi:hypothetical protein
MVRVFGAGAAGPHSQGTTRPAPPNGSCTTPSSPSPAPSPSSARPTMFRPCRLRLRTRSDVDGIGRLGVEPPTLIININSRRNLDLFGWKAVLFRQQATSIKIIRLSAIIRYVLTLLLKLTCCHVRFTVVAEVDLLPHAVYPCVYFNVLDF